MSAFQYPFVANQNTYNGTDRTTVSTNLSRSNGCSNSQLIKVQEIDSTEAVLCRNCGVTSKYGTGICAYCQRKLPIPVANDSPLKRKRDSDKEDNDDQIKTQRIEPSSSFYGNKQDITNKQCNFYQKIQQSFKAIYSVNLRGHSKKKAIMGRGKSASQDCITISSDEEGDKNDPVSYQSAQSSQTTSTDVASACVVGQVALPELNGAQASTTTTITEVDERRSTRIANAPKTNAQANIPELIDLGFTGERKTLFIFPPCGKQAIEVTTEDSYCLNAGEFLNDVIIEFYLKFIYMNILTDEQQDKSYIFSSFFYKSLSSPDKFNKDLSLPERRHNKVKKWTRNVDLFEKDFIFVPINEAAHWFLAVICFPKLIIGKHQNSQNDVKQQTGVKQEDLKTETVISTALKAEGDLDNGSKEDAKQSDEELKQRCRLSPCKVVVKAVTDDMINKVSIQELELMLSPTHKQGTSNTVAQTIDENCTVSEEDDEEPQKDSEGVDVNREPHIVDSAVGETSTDSFKENEEVRCVSTNDPETVLLGEEFPCKVEAETSVSINDPQINNKETCKSIDNSDADALLGDCVAEQDTTSIHDISSELTGNDQDSVNNDLSSGMPSEEDIPVKEMDSQCSFQESFIKALEMENNEKTNHIEPEQLTDNENTVTVVLGESETKLNQCTNSKEIGTAKLLKTSEIAFHDFYYPQPCILIFDSLRGTSKSLVVKTLREYLTAEWNTKKKDEFGEMEFTKDNIRMCTPQVPQQDNYSDCGIFLLQYVEMFFMKPINNFQIPIKHLKDWFDSAESISKREEIKELIEVLHEEYLFNKDSDS